MKWSVCEANLHDHFIRWRDICRYQSVNFCQNIWSLV